MSTVKCRGCSKKIEKEKAFCYVHYTKSGNKQNQYYCSESEYEDIKKEKEMLLQCKYITDDLLGVTCTDNSRNKKLSELHDKGYSYEEIYECILHNYKKIENVMVLKRNEFDNFYNKIAYLFGIISSDIQNFKMAKVKEDIEETIEHLDEVGGNKQMENKPTLMDIIRRNANGRK